MGWFKTALSSLFGKSKLNIGEVFSSVSKGIDNLALTDQERADKLGQFIKDTLSENSERSKARRYIAKLIIWNVIIAFWLSVVLYYMKYDIKPLLQLVNEFNLPIAFLMVLAFFFGGYYMGALGKKK